MKMKVRVIVRREGVEARRKGGGEWEWECGSKEEGERKARVTVGPRGKTSSPVSPAVTSSRA